MAPAKLNDAATRPSCRVVATTSPQEEAMQDLVDTLREESIPEAADGTGLSIDVGGTVPVTVDATAVSPTELPLFFGACCWCPSCC